MKSEIHKKSVRLNTLYKYKDQPIVVLVIGYDNQLHLYKAIVVYTEADIFDMPMKVGYCIDRLSGYYFNDQFDSEFGGEVELSN